MNRRLLLPLILLLGLIALGLAWQGGWLGGALPGLTEQPEAAPTDLRASDQVRDLESQTPESQRQELAADPRGITGVRGIVKDAQSRAPLGGVEVVAIRVPPNLERPITRFRALFGEGLWTSTARPPEILGRGLTGPDGRFEILGLPTGQIYLDAASDRAYLRNPGSVRLARGQIEEGVELLATPGGRVYGTVTGPEGGPVAGARVSIRPGINSFLGQLTQRRYRWLEAVTDEEGRYNIAGVPTGDGYALTVGAEGVALHEQYGLDVEAGQSKRVDVQAQIGALVAGRVVDSAGAPVPGAMVAMVYLDVSRMVFSADGREEPIRTDAEGRFRIPNVAPGRVAFIAAADDLAPSNIEERAVVDRGIYEDLLLKLDTGRSFRAQVVDEAGVGIRGVEVEIRPFALPRGNGRRQGGADAMKMALKVRRVRAETDAQGYFETTGIAGRRMLITCRKRGYITVVQSMVKVDAEDHKIELSRGATIKGLVVDAKGEPVTRFRVRARSRLPREPRRPRGEAAAEPGAGERGEERVEQVVEEALAEAESEQQGGAQVRFGGRSGGRRGRMRGRRWDRVRTQRLPESSGGLTDTDNRSSWKEVKAGDGHFVLGGLPSGEIRVDVVAEGFLRPETQRQTLEPGETGEELRFVLDAGATVRGRVIDAGTRVGVAEATVTAYTARERSGSALEMFRPDADAEDFDFLGMSGRQRRNSAMTDSEGNFEIRGLKDGTFRLTARHPDKAKASVSEVLIERGMDPGPVKIVLEPGGAIEGLVTGRGGLPLAHAMVVAFSVQAGAFKSDAADDQGFYRIDGLPPGSYIVFKSKMDPRSQDIGMDLMSNMRLKVTAVRRNKTSRRDIHDEDEDSVRVYGVVRDNGKPVGNAMLTFLGRDRDGLLGMGIRAKPTAADGSYEIIGLSPGEHMLQIARFRNGPRLSSIQVLIPEGQRSFRLDVELPQSTVEGVVRDRQGNPIPGIQVALEMQGESAQPGLASMMLRGGLGRARTGADGTFKIPAVAAGEYRLRANQSGGFGRQRGRGGRAANKYGQARIDDLQIDGRVPITGLVLVLPEAGRIRGQVVDAEGRGLSGARITLLPKDRRQRKDLGAEQALVQLFGLPQTGPRSDAEGRFEITGVTPGEYMVRAEIEGKAPGLADDVQVVEAQASDCRITVIQGATLHLRVRNIDGGDLPLANITVLDSKGKPLADKVSVFSLFRRYMKGQQKKESSGWHEIGDIPPDTYTIIVKEKGAEDLRITRQVRDGEEARWDIDMKAELEAYRKSQKK